MRIHTCHANGCDNLAYDVFCMYHESRLPLVHLEKIFQILPLNCGYCDKKSDDVDPQWYNLANLGIAILCFLDYGDHDCPSSYCDEKNFCWFCGVNNPKKTFSQAKEIVKRFRLK